MWWAHSGVGAGHYAQMKICRWEAELGLHMATGEGLNLLWNLLLDAASFALFHLKTTYCCVLCFPSFCLSYIIKQWLL